MEKTLIMVYGNTINDENLFSDIINISTTEGKNIDTFEKAEQIIIDNYTSEVTNWSIVQEGDEIYLYADQELPCQNCP
jgi:hypothetical protein